MISISKMFLEFFTRFCICILYLFIYPFETQNHCKWHHFTARSELSSGRYVSCGFLQEDFLVIQSMGNLIFLKQ